MCLIRGCWRVEEVSGGGAVGEVGESNRFCPSEISIGNRQQYRSRNIYVPQFPSLSDSSSTRPGIAHWGNTVELFVTENLRPFCLFHNT